MNRTIALAALGAVALAGCSKKPPAELPPPPQANSGPLGPTGPATPNGPIPGTEAHFANPVILS